MCVLSNSNLGYVFFFLSQALTVGPRDRGVVAVGAHADSLTFRGQFDDVEAAKRATGLPALCNDFLVYGYQIFRARVSEQ